MKILEAGLKRAQLEKELKDKIISGEFAPGSRLPTYEQMNRRFNASRATFHFTLRKLKSEGFLYGIERKGVFVPEKLPNRTRFALLFEDSEHENLFLSKLAREAVLLNADREQEFVFFRGYRRTSKELPQWNELREQLEQRRLAGCCFFFDPVQPELRQLIRDFPDVPKLMYNDYPAKEGFTFLSLDQRSCAEQGVSCLKEQDCRRLAILSKDLQPLAGEVEKCAARGGLECREEWIHSVPSLLPHYAEHLILLLMSLPADRRPDALYITDDNLLNNILAGLVKAGIRVPEELKIVCHTNFPDNAPAILPIRKIGFDVREILLESVRVIGLIHSGSLDRNLKIKGRSEHED